MGHAGPGDICRSLVVRLRLATLALAALAAASASAQSGTGAVAVAVRQPGDYGRIDIGNAVPPLVYAQPLVIDAPPDSTHHAPVYLYVPPTQKGHWGRYCGRYAACDLPVLFVQLRWVIERYNQRPG